MQLRKMIKSCLWSGVAVSAIFLLIGLTKGQEPQRLYKVNEVGNSLVDGKYCGDQIMQLFTHYCFNQGRKRRSVFLNEQEATSFLLHNTQRHRRQASSSQATNVWEECCIEGCAHEEVKEYC
ncbi:uncharacterized protein [Acropora muricata]|uniref:uncharacterized protein n=1 Tax=Acropora muricata TaxID=159855 RepID=UPI0010FCC0C7|nr:uncharacterized protein LOC114963903 isoform X2 [Acropora millepora]